MGQLELSKVTGGSVNWYNYPGRLFGSIHVLKLTRCIPSDSAIPNSRYVTQRNTCLCSPKDRYRNVYIGIICNSQKHPNFY